jgi:hypothetical protein
MQPEEFFSLWGQNKQSLSLIVNVTLCVPTKLTGGIFIFI